MTNKTTLLGGVSVPVFSVGTCSTCGCGPSVPYRRHGADRSIVEGCVDSTHTGHLYGNSLAWHCRPAAKACRKGNPFMGPIGGAS